MVVKGFRPCQLIISWNLVILADNNSTLT